MFSTSFKAKISPTEGLELGEPSAGWRSTPTGLEHSVFLAPPRRLRGYQGALFDFAFGYDKKEINEGQSMT